MAKISEIVNQNPLWKHGEKFAIFDKKEKGGFRMVRTLL